MHYVAVIDKDPDSAYGVQFPRGARLLLGRRQLRGDRSQRDRGVEPVLRGRRAGASARPGSRCGKRLPGTSRRARC